MLKREETFTKLQFSYKKDENSEDEWVIVFTIQGENQTIKISGDGLTYLANCKAMPFEMLCEVVDSIKRWKRSDPGITSPQSFPLGPVVKDHRSETQVDPLVDSMAKSAEQIQTQVESSMKELDPKAESFTSLSQKTTEEAKEANAQLELNEDPVGISVDDLAALGPVPDTSSDFKAQLQKIGRQTVQPPLTDEDKKIQRADG